MSSNGSGKKYQATWRATKSAVLSRSDAAADVAADPRVQFDQAVFTATEMTGEIGLGHELDRLAHERTRLVAKLDAFDTLGEFLKLDDVENALIHSDAEFRAHLAVQRAILQRAQEALSEASVENRARYLTQLHATFLATTATSESIDTLPSARPVPEEAQSAKPDVFDLMQRIYRRNRQTREGNIRASVGTFRAIHRIYLWKRLFWALWRYLFYVVCIVAFLLVAIFIPGGPKPWLLLLLLVPAVAWLLAQTVLAGPLERMLVQRRRAYLRVWATHLYAARLRLEPEIVLALNALEPTPETSPGIMSAEPEPAITENDMPSETITNPDGLPALQADEAAAG